MIRIIYSCGHTEEYQGNDEVIKRRNICPECDLYPVKYSI